ncbi:hypothetical protein GA0061099_10284 [Bradyrhizobium yuanmingense]|uniref:Uncharacterized protein n=1 Tax=Bradyrhizobium yuanmingense TaxID=108015 RepID=A0A1C3XIS7_9BRAD|nr:hypothetical protein IQ15_07334 [Bradyrhizobium yuanmingense]SCB52163.1 hypothetical protein GA0061099_10284 [Bradyrhizobium yuanmingense]
MIHIYGFRGWRAVEWFRNAGPRTEQVNLLRDNVIYVDFRAIGEAKERACERR